MMYKSEEIAQLVLVIHNVRSAHNVGSLFRTADGAGVEKIILTGYTPAPPEPGKLFFSPAEKAFQKTALGAEKAVLWEKRRLFCHAWRQYHPLGYQFIALEQTAESIDYRKLERVSLKRVLVVGNEVRGLDARISKACDHTIHLPMRGRKESLNVSVAGAIALYHLRATMEEYYAK